MGNKENTHFDGINTLVKITFNFASSKQVYHDVQSAITIG